MQARRAHPIDDESPASRKKRQPCQACGEASGAECIHQLVPLENGWVPNGEKRLLCQDCLRCQQCFVDDHNGLTEIGLCRDCATPCGACRRAVPNDDGLQDATDQDAGYLCKSCCCVCLAVGGEVKELPEAGRYYCRKCVVSGVWYTGAGLESYPHDDSHADWARCRSELRVAFGIAEGDPQ